MIVQGHRVQGAVLAAPVRRRPPTQGYSAGGWVRRAGAIIQKNPLVILVAIFNAAFYAAAIALLANL